MESRIVEILKAGSVIERDGVRHLLEANDIPCMTEHRDMIVVLGHEPTLSLEGYSSFFDGYKIFVRSEDKEKAEQLIRENFPAETSASIPDHPRKFLMSCLFSMTFLPIIGHVTAIYHLKKAIQHKQRIGAVNLIVGFLFWSFAIVLFYVSGGLGSASALKMWLGF